MNILLILIPVSLFLGGLALVLFVWTLRADQYDDPDGAANRVLLDDDQRPAGPRQGITRTTAER
ncbi:cbb3-type cytochrome oxidase assembly protein CcoS [Paracoccus zhejiangensis]|uniref:Cbb3-type cytochrome oxidase assembly protein CcoS n=1 Tax=Paracoccus zhejiangensis TaxID=1077935 RepID=A0A2H5EVT0_9RHOB|nr:cbb3-type cytochrome oxidase assembly protein CcoS [Paracoccus zhejiangensis]AUH63397.1 cbb3-type cytochrome oxidase assembly protein CcoS [Paracoccus zhejiangensis]